MNALPVLNHLQQLIQVARWMNPVYVLILVLRVWLWVLGWLYFDLGLIDDVSKVKLIRLMLKLIVISYGLVVSTLLVQGITNERKAVALNRGCC
jgi:hypothetical protein